MNLKAMTQAEFTQLDTKARRTYLEAIEEKFHPTMQQLCKMFGGENPIKESTLNLLKTQCGLSTKSFQRYHTDKAQERAWAIFLYDIPVAEPEVIKPTFDRIKVNSDICERIKKAREDAKLSGEAIANELGIAKSNISRYENPSKEYQPFSVPAYYTLFIAHKTGVSVNYLLTGNDDAGAAIKEVPTIKEKVAEKVVFQENTQEILAKAFKEIGQQLEYLESIPESMLTAEAKERLGKGEVYKLAISDIRLKVAEVVAREKK